MARNNLRQRFTAKEQKIVLVTGHILSVLLALFIALIAWANEDAWLGISLSFLSERPSPWFFALPVLWLILIFPLYEVRKVNQYQRAIKVVSIAVFLCVGIYLAVFFLAPAKTLPRRGVIVFFIAAPILSLIWQRIFAKCIYVRKECVNTIIVGAGKAGTYIARIINEEKETPYKIIGFIDDDPQKLGSEIEGHKVLGSSKEYFKIINDNKVTQVIMAISNNLGEEVFDALSTSEEQGITVTTMPTMYEDILGRVPVPLLNTDWLLRSFYDMSHQSLFYEISKRAVDIAGSIVGMFILLLTSPFIALATVLDTGRPIIYTQERLGLRGAPFNMIKFRTMIVNAEENGVQTTAVNDTRITKVGEFLRRSHLDELPQFINVLKGELSLVGPRAERPEIIKDLQREVPFYRARLLVKPGITGWAQVNQKYASSTEEQELKLEYDLYYIKHRSFLFDLSILFQTFKTVFGLKGR